MSNNSINLDVSPNADGFMIGGGTTERKLTLTGGDISITGGGSTPTAGQVLTADGSNNGTYQNIPTLNQNTTGNAGTATTLATPRTINGVSFNGSANITVADSTKVPTTTTVNGHALSANVTVSQSDVGLGNVSNTSDATKLTATLQAIYPVGSIYQSATVSTSPATVLGFGTWTALTGYALVGYKSGDSNFGATGVVAAGEKTHTLTIGEMPAHTHPINGSSGGAVNVGPAGTTNSNGNLANSFPGGIATSTGGDGAHNNIQPSYVVYQWYRSA